jgi:hypothetical protein
MQSTVHETSDDSIWPQLTPLMDEAMARLGKKDRDAVVLRFFKAKEMCEVAAALHASEAATHKRVSRGLEKLRKFFLNRGVNSTASAIAKAMSANSIQAAPVTLAKSVTAVALAKGAAASTSTLVTIKGTLKAMAWTKAKTALIAGAVVLLATGGTTVAVMEIGGGSGSVDAQVSEIVRDNSKYPFDDGAALIAKIGPRAMPSLERLIRWKKSDWYPFGTAEHEKLRASAMGIASQLGPAAVRPLTSALCDALTDRDFIDYDHLANANVAGPVQSRLLEWSVPDSPAATTTLANVFSNTATTFFPGGYGGGDEIYSHLPNAVELITPWLKNPAAVWQAARILGTFGTNAAAAIPDLIQVADQGVEQPETRVLSVYSYIPRGQTKPVLNTRLVMLGIGDDQRAQNRGAALDALGKTGLASPEVVAALQRNLMNPHNVVSFAALKDLYALHQPPAVPLADVLDHFSPRREIEFDELVQWVGGLGEQGRDALPWLRRLSDLSYVQSILDGIHTSVGSHIAVTAENLRASAIASIGEIDPSLINPGSIDPVARLRAAGWNEMAQARGRSNTAPLVAILTPLLDSTNGDDFIGDSTWAAHVLLGIDPANQNALQTLRRNATEGDLNWNRLTAAEWLSDQTANPSNLLNLLIEGLISTNKQATFAAPQLLAKMGAAARPAIPALKNALWSQNDTKRDLAGRALQKIAPEELPPIH